MFKVWFTAIRPKTLTAAVVPIVVASSLVYFEGEELNLKWSLFALISALLIQIATNLFNDAIDFKKGADTQERIGPKRITQAGEGSYKTVMWAAVFCCFLALLFGFPLVLRGGWPFVAIGVASLFLAYSYTGGPFPLAYLGLGDVFVILFFGVIAVGGVYYLQTLRFSTAALVAGLQVGFLSTVLLAINNFRDIEQDKKANKKTLVVRWGKSFGRLEIIFLFLLTVGLNYYWWLMGAEWAGLLPLVTLPLIIYIINGVLTTSPSIKYNKFLAQSAGVQILFCTLLSVGFLMS